MGILVIIYKCYYNARMKYVALKLINFICRYNVQMTLYLLKIKNRGKNIMLKDLNKCRNKSRIKY